MESRVEKHAKYRDELNVRYVGHIGESTDAVPEVAEVQQRTGIKPPAWFNTGGVSISQVNAIGVSQHARRR